METKHTPGPWNIDPKRGNVVQFSNEDFNIKDCELWKHQYEDIEELKSNAKLIAAAPDMLEALIIIDWANSVPAKDWDEKTYNACQQVKLAIKKATE